MSADVYVDDSWLIEAASVLKCKMGDLPLLYLGLPISGDSRKLNFWQPLLHRIQYRMFG